jgi:hypothetical protein
MFVRRQGKEGSGNHVIILDFKSNNCVRFISLYLCFIRQGRSTPRDMFRRQLEVIKNAMTDDIIIM